MFPVHRSQFRVADVQKQNNLFNLLINFVLLLVDTLKISNEFFIQDIH